MQAKDLLGLRRWPVYCTSPSEARNHHERQVSNFLLFAPSLSGGKFHSNRSQGANSSLRGNAFRQHGNFPFCRRFGSRVSYNFSRHNAAEFTIANPFSLTANYVYNFCPLREKWVPYVTAGVGGTRREIALSDNNQPAQLNSNLMETGPDRSQTAFTGNFGGGAKYFFMERFALRFDVRDQVGHYKATFSNVAGVPGGIVTGSKTLNEFQITGGIVFRSGGKR